METVDLERSLLHLLTTSVIVARMQMHRVKVEWFTSNTRKFIFRLSKSTLSDSKSILTKRIFEFELRNKVSDKDRDIYLAEWNFIEAIDTVDSPEILIDKLIEASVGREVLQAAESVADLLDKGDIIQAVQKLKRSAMSIGIKQAELPTVEIVEYNHRLDLIRDKQRDPAKYLGIKTGFPTFDRRTGGLFPQELTLIAGITGTGKSVFTKTLCKNITEINYGKNVLLIVNEESALQAETKMDSVLTGISYLDFKLAKISEEDIDKWTDFLRKDMQDGRGRIFIKEVPAFSDITLIETAYRELEQKNIPIHVIIIDHLPHVVPVQRAWDPNDERFKAATECKQLAKDLNLPVVTPTQASTDVAKKQSKGQRAGEMDVYGSRGQIHVANTFVILTRRGVDNTQIDREEEERDVFLLADAKKVRDGARHKFNIRLRVREGLMEEIPDESQEINNEAVDEVVAEAENMIKEKKSLESGEQHLENEDLDENELENEHEISGGVSDLEKQAVNEALSGFSPADFFKKRRKKSGKGV